MFSLVRRRCPGHFSTVVLRYFSAMAPLARPDPLRFEAPDVAAALKKGEVSLDDLDNLSVFNHKVKAAVRKLGYDELTPVQSRSLLPMLMEDGVVCRAKTGTGKTMAFAIPIVQACLDHYTTTEQGKTHALVVAPTRDLANQIRDEFEKLLTHRALKKQVSIQISVGGKQDSYLKYPPAILIATPGRLEARLRDPRVARLLSDLKYKVYDEADRLLDQGFEETLHSIDESLAEAHEKYGDGKTRTKNVLFSATIDKRMDDFARETIGKDYKFINCVSDDEPEAHENIHQTIVHTKSVLESHVAAISDIFRHKEENPNYKAIVFVPTVSGSEFIYNIISDLSPTPARRWLYKLNGGMSQGARDRTTERFRSCTNGVLVCTDVAARGLDFKNVTDVIQFSASSKVADYVHKVGRTARAGTSGNAILYLCAAESRYRRALEKEHGITFSKEVAYETFAEDKEQFERLNLDYEDVNDYVRSMLGFYRAAATVYRYDWTQILKDLVWLLRDFSHEPTAVIKCSEKFMLHLKVPYELVPEYVDGPMRRPRGDYDNGSRRGGYKDRNDRGKYGNKSFGRSNKYRDFDRNSRNSRDGRHDDDGEGFHRNDRSLKRSFGRGKY